MVTTVSKVNRRPLPDMTYMKELVMTDPSEKKDQKYSFMDLFKTPYLRKITCLLSINWYVHYVCVIYFISCKFVY